MKSNRFSRLALTSLCVALFASASFAQTLISPRGMAVDSSGNLWVANAGGNNILVYNSAYVQQTSKTITQGITMPAAVAFDSADNLWVANGSLNGGGPTNLTQYSGGKPTGMIITEGINNPLAMAIDGLNDIWVQNNHSNVTVYGRTAVFYPPTTLLQTFSGFPPYNGIAASGDAVSMAWNNIELYDIGSSLVTTALASDTVGQSLDQFHDGVALAIGGNNLYFADSDGQVYLDPGFVGNIYGNPTLLTTVSYYATGMAIDIVRERIYIADYNDSAIDVFNFKGKLIHTIN
jgi:DNA-binding beta-propeller fold protein YncE